jgi:AP-4 complex subunit sigma-1
MMMSQSVLQAHFIVDEMLMNGRIVETNKQNVLAPVQLLDKAL